MSKRTLEDIQRDFNELGSQLLQVELGIERFKEALTKANSDKNKFMQKLVNLDNEFQSIKYAGLKVQEASSDEMAQDSGNEMVSPLSGTIAAG